MYTSVHYFGFTISQESYRYLQKSWNKIRLFSFIPQIPKPKKGILYSLFLENVLVELVKCVIFYKNFTDHTKMLTCIL